MIFVHEGSGTLETIFGDLPYKDGDYVVVPRGRRTGSRPTASSALIFETPGLIEIPRRYRNQYGQILEGRPTTTAISIRRPAEHTPGAG